MAVQRVAAGPIAEPEKELYALVRMQLGHVLSGLLDRQRRGHAVARQNLMLLQMNMDRVRPVACCVCKEPVLDTVLLDTEADVVAVHELAVDGPLSIQAVELEGPGDTRSGGRVRQRVERLGGGVRAAVGDRPRTYVEPQ